MRDDKARLLDIQEAILKIEKYAGQGKAAFEVDELIQTWMLHNLQVIGEAAARLSECLKDAEPGVPWKKIAGMRNILVHGYFDIDLEIVWNAVENDIPGLKKSLARVLERLGGM